MWSSHVIITSHSWSEISSSRCAYEVHQDLLIICISTDQRRYTASLLAMGNSSSNHLGIPPGKGPEAVGCTDVMMDHTAQVNTWPPQEKPFSVTDKKVVDLCVSTSQGSFIRLYYPCQEPEGAEKPDWIPCREYFNGLADFMKINRTLSERIFNYLYGNLYFICVLYQTGISTHGPGTSWWLVFAHWWCQDILMNHFCIFRTWFM